MGTIYSSKKFSVFNFADDEVGEENSRWKLSAAESEKNKTSAFADSPVDKYKFLECFTKEKDRRNEALVVDEAMKERICRSNAASQSSSSNHKLDNHSRPKYLESITSYCGGNSNTSRILKVPSDRKNFDSTQPHPLPDNEPVLINSDEDNDDASTISSNDLEDNEGSSGIQILEHDTAASDTESVVVSPKYVICGGHCFGRAQLTFSYSSIKLDVSEEEGVKDSLNFATADLVYIESRWCERLETAIINLHIKSENSKVAASGHDSEILEVELVVNDPHWIQTQELIKSLNMRYEEKWDDLDSYESFEDVTYPEGDCDSISISKRDIQLLKPEKFINDTIVDFYIKYLKKNIEPAVMQRIYFFNSFFFRKLAEFDDDRLRSFDSYAAFQRVRKWTKKVHLFQKDYIFIPINFSLHWSLIVICHPGEVMNFRDEELEISQKVPCILHLDSIRGRHTGLRKCIQSYLWEEWKERSSDPAEVTSSKFLKIPFLRFEVPQQQNSFDCGLFMLHYMELFVKQAPLDFNPSGTFLRKDWFSPAEASAKRAHIKRLIFEIAKHKSQEAPLCNDKWSSESQDIYAEDTDICSFHETYNSKETHLSGNSVVVADGLGEVKMVKPLRSVPLPSSEDGCSESEDINEEDTDLQFFHRSCDIKESNLGSDSGTDADRSRDAMHLVPYSCPLELTCVNVEHTGRNLMDTKADGERALLASEPLRGSLSSQEQQSEYEQLPEPADIGGAFVAENNLHHQQIVLYKSKNVLSPVKELEERKDALGNQIAVTVPSVTSIGSSLNLLQLEGNKAYEELSELRKSDDCEAFVVEDSIECSSSSSAHLLEVVEDSDSESEASSKLAACASEKSPHQRRIFVSPNHMASTSMPKAVAVDRMKPVVDLEEGHTPKRRRLEGSLDVQEILSCE